MKEALELFSIFAWDDTDKASKDVIRYMGLPGQATAYTIGRAAILKMRNETEEALGDLFDEREFHYIILSQVIMRVLCTFILLFIEAWLRK